MTANLFADEPAAVEAAVWSWAALWPSTWSAFRPVATPVAFVVNGAALVLPDVMRPTSGPPLDENSNARPSARSLARTQGWLPFSLPPALERQRRWRRRRCRTCWTGV